jgi:hypothetical protein
VDGAANGRPDPWHALREGYGQVALTIFMLVVIDVPRHVRLVFRLPVSSPRFRSLRFRRLGGFMAKVPVTVNMFDMPGH